MNQGCAHGCLIPCWKVVMVCIGLGQEKKICLGNISQKKLCGMQFFVYFLVGLKSYALQEIHF